MPKFTAAYLSTLACALLEQAGTPRRIALRVSEIIVNANLAGHDSHGVMRLPEYLDQLDRKQIVPSEEPQVTHETPATAVMDGRRGWGHYAVDRAMSLAIQKARTVGIGAVALYRCNHAGRMGEYVTEAAQAGCIGMLMAGLGGTGVGCAAPYGGRGRYLGTNPMAVGVPSGGEFPFVLDFATTTVAQGKLKVAQSKHESVPEGWMLDAEGKPSTRPEDFFEGGTLLPFGGHKGYALSLMTCLMGGLSGVFQAERSALGGIYVQAADVAAFQPGEGYLKNVRSFLDAIKSAPPAREDQAVLLPGEPEHLNRLARLRDGIELPDSVWEQLTAAANSRELHLPTP